MMCRPRFMRMKRMTMDSEGESLDSLHDAYVAHVYVVCALASTLGCRGRIMVASQPAGDGDAGMPLSFESPQT